MHLKQRLAALAVSCPIAMAGAAETLSLCQQLAGHVWRASYANADVSPNQWIKGAGAEDPGSLDGPAALASGLLRKALDPSPEGTPGSIVEITRLPGTPVYMGSMLGGTAHCETVAFAVVETGGKVRQIEVPEGYTTPCWNLQGSLATVLGAAAYVEQGTTDGTSADTLTRVTPWARNGWGRACQLTVQFKYRYRLAHRFCGDQAACVATAAVATDVAQKYIAQRLLSPPPTVAVGLDQPVPDFLYVDSGFVSPGAQAAVANGWQLLARRQQVDVPGVPVMASTISSRFPTFGEHVPNEGWDSSFSYVGFTLFPMVLNGHLYLGAMAHDGVGWREGSNILIAAYEPPVPGQAELVPLVGLVVERYPAGLLGTVVAEGGSAVPVPAKDR